MRFDPASDELGTLISGIATAVVYGGAGVLIAMPYIRRRREDDETSGDSAPEDVSGGDPSGNGSATDAASTKSESTRESTS
jgi:hypothetical protein